MSPPGVSSTYAPAFGCQPYDRPTKTVMWPFGWRFASTGHSPRNALYQRISPASSNATTNPSAVTVVSGRIGTTSVNPEDARLVAARCSERIAVGSSSVAAVWRSEVTCPPRPIASTDSEYVVEARRPTTVIVASPEAPTGANGVSSTDSADSQRTRMESAYSATTETVKERTLFWL